MEDSYMDFEEHDSETQGDEFFKPSYVLIGIDTNSAMFKTEGTPSFFKKCLTALYRLCDDLLLATDKKSWCPFAVVLFDKDEKATFVDFKDNMIEINKLLKEKSSSSEAKLKEMYMRNYDLDLAGFFQLCKKKFKDLGSKFYKRTIIFMTDDPDPVNGDSSKRFTALNEAKNFEENDIDFQLIVTNPDFNFSIFYDELFSLLKTEYRNLCEDEEQLHEEISTSIWFRYSRRKLIFYPFADDLSKFIAVYKRTYFKQARLLSNGHVARDGTLVKKIQKAESVKDEDPAGYGEGVEVLKYEKEFPELTFDLSEKAEAYCSGSSGRFPIGYTLLYLSDRLTGLGEVLAEPCVVETDKNETLPYFGQFWQHCAKTKKVMVCARVMKRGEEPRAVELIPKLIGKCQVFLVKRIPHANEVNIPIEAADNEDIKVKASDEEKEIVNRIIDRLTMSFSTSHLIDESHERKEKYLKSKLLGEPRDDFEPKEFQSEEEIDEKLDDLINRYMECFTPILQEKGAKRKRE